MTNILKKILKILGYIVGGILLLLILIALLLQTPPVQDFVKEKAVTFLKDKIETEFTVGKLRIDFPYDLVVEDVYLEDQQEDTLAYLERLRIEAQMWGLFKGNLSISEIDVDGLVGFMSRNEQDSTFNFQFLADAFAPADTTATDTTQQQSSPFQITIDEVQVDNSRFYYTDPIEGIDMQYGIGDLGIAIDVFDLENNKITVSQITLKNSYGDFNINKEPPPSEEESEPLEFDFGVEDVLIADVRFSFESAPDEIKLFTKVGELEGQLEEIDIMKMDYYANELALRNTLVELDLYGEGGTVDTLEQEPPAITDTVTLNVGSDLVTFENVNFRFDDHTAPKTEGFDPMHFAFTDINARFEDPEYRLENEDSYASGEVASLTLKEKAGMVLEKFNGVAEFTPTHISAEDIDLIAGESEIHGDFRMTYESLEALADNPEEMGLYADLAPTVISLNDVVYFVPDMKEQMQQFPPAAQSLRIEGELDGKLSALDIDYFRLDGLKNTHIRLRGNIAGIPDVNNINVDLVLEQFVSTRTDLKALLPDTLIPEDITIPERFGVTGSLSGTMDQARGNLDINTSMGNASVDASIEMDQDSIYHYDGQLVVNEFNVGRLLQQEDQFGVLSANIHADGEGFTMEKINTKLEGEVSSFTYNNYTYEDLQIDGHVFKQEFSGSLAMDDENLDFSFEGTVDMNDSIPAFMFYLELDNADLQALNFAEEDISVEGTIDSDLRAKDLKQINGFVIIDDLLIRKNGERYAVDSLKFISEQQGEETKLSIRSDILSANFEGEFNVIDLPQVMQAHINQYYEILDTTSIQGIEPQSFTFNIDIKRTGIFTEVLVPELESFTPGEISGTYDSENWEMDISIEIPEINYAGMIIDSLDVSIQSDEEELTYDARVASFQTGVTPIDNIWLEGVVASNHINTALHILDDQGENKYLFGGIFTTWQEQYYQLQMTPGRVMMNYQDWEVYPGNSIQFYPSGIIIEEMRLSHNEQQLEANTVINEQQDTLINVDFSRFRLSTIANLSELDTTYVSGLVNGEVSINNSSEAFAFTSDLSVRNIAYKTDTLGNLSINAYTADAERYSLTASLDGRDNEMLIEGYYEADTATGVLHFDADLEQLSLTTIEALSMGELSQSRGYITADMAIRGTVDDPELNGTVGFKDAMTNVNYLGAFFLIDDEKIRFDNRGIHFSNFTINDGSGNDLNVNGDILTNNYQYFEFDLNASMNNFLLLNTGAGDNPLYYGTLIADSDISVQGDSELPVINMNIDLNNESRLTYIVPETELMAIEREGLVEFVDRSEMAQDSLVALEESPSDTLEAEVEGIDFTANINVDPSNSVTVVIDPTTGDRLSNLRGEASLALNINPTGDISLNGRYTVEEGTYIMRLFGLAKREFDIVEGSYLLWTGDPLDARMDLQARYQVEATPEPILNSPYQKVPILVYLELDGRLLNPEISFRLSMPEDERPPVVMGALQDINNRESELMQQVLSLVVFRRFMQDNFLAGGGGGVEGTARQSVSRVLSQQLNQLGAQIEGVDLTFDVQSYQDYSQTGETFNRTQVELGVEKAFFDDRVNVKLAGNFDVEGERSRQQNMSDFAGDIIIEYLITEDGRLRLLVFRENEFDDLLGQVIETGAGIIYVKEYDSISELFN
ncbi:MAG: translocation/assembly module TamB domain-containing protein [Candidatus Cyclobacteriaceae bacterium M2_1C_046]